MFYSAPSTKGLEMPDCVVPGCPVDAQNVFGVRLRRPDTSAIWAPNTEAFICDQQAKSGARIRVYYEATESGEVDVDVHGATAEHRRLTTIKQPDQETLGAALHGQLTE